MPFADCNLRVASDYNNFLQKIQSIYTKNILRRLYVKLQYAKRDPVMKKQPVVKVVGVLCQTQKQLQSLAKLFSSRLGRTDLKLVRAETGSGKTAAASIAQGLILDEDVKLLLVVGNALSSVSRKSMRETL